MEPHRIEEWALRIIDRVNRRQPVEDSRVELKADWPEPGKAARRIAGHANAARGAPILWLIGVDERQGVVGVGTEESSTWFSSVRARFEELAPVLTDLAVPVGNLMVMALLFETDRAPFVVKNPAYNSRGGGPVQFEVPWREATAVRSARRSDLIRMLSPLRSSPEIEVLGAELEAQRDGERLHWSLEVDLYVVTDAGEQVVIPYHAYDVSVEEHAKPVGSPELARMRFEHRAISSPDNTARQEPGSRNLLVMSNSVSGTRGNFAEELRLFGPGRVTLGAMTTSELLDVMTVTKVLVRANLRPVRSGATIPVDVLMTKRYGDHHRHQWLQEGAAGVR